MARANLRAKLTMDTAEAKAALRSFQSQSGSAGKGAAKSFEEANRGAMIFTGSLKRMLPVMGGLVGIGAGGGVLSKAIGSAADFERMEAQFSVFLGNTTQARARLEELAKFAAETPFTLPELATANRILEKLTGGALSTKEGMKLLGDTAAAAGTDIENLSMWFGRLYDGIMSGRPVGEAMMRLQELGLISGTVRNQLEDMQKAGAEGSEIWAVAEKNFKRFEGTMKVSSQTFRGLSSTVGDNFNALFRELGEVILPGVKGGLQGVNATLKDTVSTVRTLKDIDAGENFTTKGGIWGMLSNIHLAVPAAVAGLAEAKGQENDIRAAEARLVKVRELAEESKRFREQFGGAAERNRAALTDKVRRDRQEYDAEMTVRNVFGGNRRPFEDLVRAREDALERLNELRRAFDEAETEGREKFVKQLRTAAEDLEAARKALQTAQSKAIMGATTVGLNVGGIGGPSRNAFPGGLGFAMSMGIGSAIQFAKMGAAMVPMLQQRNRVAGFQRGYMRWLSTAGNGGVRSNSSRAAGLAIMQGAAGDTLDETNGILREISDNIKDSLTVK